MTTTTPKLEETLAGMPLLSHLGSRRLVRLARLTTRRRFRPGTVIVRQGDTSMAMYILLSGSVRIQRESPWGTQVVGEEGPGAFFGEMGLIDDMPRASTVVGLESCECALLAKWDFENELRSDPEIGLELLRALAARIRTLDDRLSELAKTDGRTA